MTANGPLVAGVDSSTQSTKVVVRRLEDGQPVAEGRAPHPVTEPPRSEQDPASWWQALVAAFADLGPVPGGDPDWGTPADIGAISISGQQHGFVVLDSGGDPIRPAKLWNDT